MVPPPAPTAPVSGPDGTTGGPPLLLDEPLDPQLAGGAWHRFVAAWDPSIPLTVVHVVPIEHSLPLAHRGAQKASPSNCAQMALVAQSLFHLTARRRPTRRRLQENGRPLRLP